MMEQNPSWITKTYAQHSKDVSQVGRFSSSWMNGAFRGDPQAYDTRIESVSYRWGLTLGLYVCMTIHSGHELGVIISGINGGRAYVELRYVLFPHWHWVFIRLLLGVPARTLHLKSVL
jgi:hypothetical protein